jgi:hypothetical protein
MIACAAAMRALAAAGSIFLPHCAITSWMNWLRRRPPQGASIGRRPLPPQQFLDIPQQAVVGRKPNRVLHPAFFQHFVNFRFGKRGVGPKHHFLPQFLLVVDLRQRHFGPVLGNMQVSRPQMSVEEAMMKRRASFGDGSCHVNSYLTEHKHFRNVASLPGRTKLEADPRYCYVALAVRDQLILPCY